MREMFTLWAGVGSKQSDAEKVASLANVLIERG